MTAVENQIEIIINGIQFKEIKHNEYLIHSVVNPYPFLKCVHNEITNIWRYKSLILDGKFYAPNHNIFP